MSNVTDFGAAADGKRDDTEAIEHALADGDGVVQLPRGDYRITRTIEIDTIKTGRVTINGSGGTAKIIMAGAGPALSVIGNHAGTADPGSMKAEVWRSQRMPIISELEIEGAHAEADGIQLSGTVQAIVKNVGMHRLRHGVRLVKRSRNTIIEGCQIYHNTGVGVFFDGVNLHQVNIIGNHISYNRLGGIRIERSEVRNLQITGNDIEYNTDRTHKIKEEPTAEIYIDATADGATVNEVTIASNTIQATPSTGGANLRIIEDGTAAGRPPGLYAITGNVIGSQTNNVHLTGCYGMTLTGNCIYSAVRHNLLLENCRQMVLSSNQFRRHTPDMGTGMRLAGCTDCVISACHLLDESETGQTSGLSLLELADCQRITISGCQLINGSPHCLEANSCKDVIVSGSTLIQGVQAPRGKATIRWTGKGFGNLITGCRVRRGLEGAWNIDDGAGVKLEGNLESD